MKNILTNVQGVQKIPVNAHKKKDSRLLDWEKLKEKEIFGETQ